MPRIARAFGERDEMKWEVKYDICLRESQRLRQEIEFQYLIKSIENLLTETCVLSLQAGEGRHAGNSKLPSFRSCVEIYS
jgi:hypothetical protein